MSSILFINSITVISKIEAKKKKKRPSGSRWFDVHHISLTSVSVPAKDSQHQQSEDPFQDVCIVP